MILSFRSKALSRLFKTGTSGLLAPGLRKRALVILDVLDQVKVLSDLNLPGLDFHSLRGYIPKRYTVHVNGPWCITFEFKEGEIRHVDLEQYH